MSNWYKPHLKSAYNAQDKTFVSRLNRLRFFHDRRVLKFLRWKKGDLGRRLRGVHSLRWYKLRYRFGLKFYNFSSKKRRKLRVFRQNNMYKVGLDRKKNFLSFYRKFDESKIKVWFKEYYNKSRQYKVLNFFKLFETRLDVLCFRMKLLPTIFLANTFIKNTGILVNYSLVKEPGKRVAIGDLISFENSLQWSFFSSRFAEQLWKRWHRFKELNIQRKKTRLLVFREYYKKYSNVNGLDKKKQNNILFSNLENNWNFTLNNRDKKQLNFHKKKIKLFNKTFWILNFLTKKQIFTKVNPYLELVNSLLNAKINLNVHHKKKILTLLLIKYLSSKNTLKSEKYSFFSLIQFYKYRFESFLNKKQLLKKNLLKNDFLLKDFVQDLKMSNMSINSDKNSVLLKTLFYTMPSGLIFSHKDKKVKRSLMKIDSFLNFQKLKLKSVAKPSMTNSLKNYVKENSLNSKINFWSSNLLPFLRFNLNLKKLTEVIFLQFFSINSSFNFFFLKFWLGYRKILLMFSKVFIPLTKFFNYIKTLTILINQNKNSKIKNSSWFFKSLYSRFFIQKVSILANLKKLFQTDSKILNKFFSIIKNFINPSILFTNKNLIEQSLYKGYLTINTLNLDYKETEAKKYFEYFNFILKDNSLVKIALKLWSQNKLYNEFKLFFSKYNGEHNLKKIYKEYLNFLYLLVVKNLNDTFLLENFLSKSNNFDLQNNFIKDKKINSIQNKFINLSLQRSLNSFNINEDSITTDKQNNFFNENHLTFYPYKNDLKAYMNLSTKKNISKNMSFGSLKKKKVFYNLNNKWFIKTNKGLNNFFLLRNIKKQNLTDLINRKTIKFDKKSIIWRNVSIFPNFKRYKRLWKSKNWTRIQKKSLQKLIIKKQKENSITKTYMKKNFFFSPKLGNFSLNDSINRYNIRRVYKSSKKTSSNDYSNNEALLKNSYISPYLLNKIFIKKTKNITFPNSKNKVFGEYLILEQILHGLLSKMKMFTEASNSKYLVNYLKKQLNLWKKKFTNLVGSFDIKLKQKFNKNKFIIKNRKLVKSIKYFLELISISSNNTKRVFFLNKAIKYLEKLILSVKLLNTNFLSRVKLIKKEKFSSKTWLKFRLRLKRFTKNNVFKRQFFKKTILLSNEKKVVVDPISYDNKYIFIKNNVKDKPFLKRQIFIRRSKKRRKSYKLGQKQLNQRWLRKQKKKYCDVNLVKWKKLESLKRKSFFDKETWFQSDRNFAKNLFFNQVKEKFQNICLLEKFFILQEISNKNDSLFFRNVSNIKRSHTLIDLNLDKNSFKRNSLFFEKMNKKESYSLDIIKSRKNKRRYAGGSSKEKFIDKYKTNYTYLFKLNKLRRYKNLISYHQRWNKGSTTRIRYQMRTKLLNLNKVRRLRKKKFFNIRSKPLLLLPNFVEFDFVTFRSYVLSTPNLEASLYGGATNSYFYSFLSFYQRLGY